MSIFSITVNLLFLFHILFVYLFNQYASDLIMFTLWCYTCFTIIGLFPPVVLYLIQLYLCFKLEHHLFHNFKIGTWILSPMLMLLFVAFVSDWSVDFFHQCWCSYVYWSGWFSSSFWYSCRHVWVACKKKVQLILREIDKYNYWNESVKNFILF